MKIRSHSPSRSSRFHSTIEPLEARIAPATISILGTSGNDSLVVVATSADSGTYQLNGNDPVPFTGVTHFDFHGGDGDDTLTIINPAGSVFAPIDGIVYAGENQASSTGDKLVIKGGGGAAFVQTWVLGATPDAGTLKMTDGVVTQVITYSGLEPIVDTAVAASFTVSGNNGNNAINYAAGSAGRGLVSVDAAETVEFANKTTLIINGLGGSDTINLNNPTTPAGLTGITVNGNDPTDSDTLIVNGISGQLDNLRFDPTASYAGTVVNDNAPQPLVTFNGIELLKLVIQTKDGDGFRTDGTSGNDLFEFFPGSAGTAETITGTMDSNNSTGVGPFTYTPTVLIGGSQLTNDLDFNFFGNTGGTDTVIFHGTSSADTISIGSGEAGGVQISNAVDGVMMERMEMFNTASVFVHGHEGGDIFNVTPFNSSVALSIDGDEGINKLNHSTGSNVVTTLDLAASTISTAGAFTTTFAHFDTVSLSGLGGVGSALSVSGTSGDDHFTVTPNGSAAGSFKLSSLGAPTLQDVAFSYSGQATFSVGGGSGGFDVLAIVGSEAADIITSSALAVTVTHGTSSTLTLGSGLDRIDVFALGGNDHVDLSGIASLPTRILGGEGNDLLIGSPQADLLDGGPGKDVLRGGGGNDTLLNDGPFTYASPAAYDVAKLPVGVVAADVNGDGFSDLIVVNSTLGKVSVLLGSSTGLFGDPVSFSTGGTMPNSVVVGDFNGDSRLDLAVANGGSGKIGILLGDGLGSFGTATTFLAGAKNSAIHSADFNGDSFLDLAVITGTKITTLAGVGDGTFSAPNSFVTGGKTPVDFAIADFNQDTIADIVTANSGSANVSLLAGTGSGFKPPVIFKTGIKPIAIAVGDFNRDGALDLVVANASNHFLSVLLGNGAGLPQFQSQIKIATPEATVASALATADLNGDGILDLVLANTNAGTLRVFTGLGTGLFASPLDFALGEEAKLKPGALALGDFNGDGATDIAVSSLGTSDVRVLLNLPG